MSNQLQQKTTRSLADMVMFNQSFELDLDIPVQECVTRLSNLSEPQNRVVRSPRPTVDIPETNSDVATFEIHLKRYHSSYSYDYYLIDAKCVGVVYTSDKAHQTVVKGEISGGKALFTIYAVLFMSLIGAIFYAGVVVGGIFILAALLLLAQTWLDCRSLHSMISEALQ